MTGVVMLKVCVVVEDLERNDGCCYANGLCCS